METPQFRDREVNLEEELRQVQLRRLELVTELARLSKTCGPKPRDFLMLVQHVASWVPRAQIVNQMEMELMESLRQSRGRSSIIISRPEKHMDVLPQRVILPGVGRSRNYGSNSRRQAFCGREDGLLSPWKQFQTHLHRHTIPHNVMDTDSTSNEELSSASSSLPSSTRSRDEALPFDSIVTSSDYG